MPIRIALESRSNPSLTNDAPDAQARTPREPREGPDVALWLVRLLPTRPRMLAEGPTEAEAEAITAHLRHLQDLARQGVVLLAGRTATQDERTFGIVLLQAPTEEAARSALRRDPAVLARVMIAELLPYRIAVLNDAILRWAPPA